jgi:HPt (histidine-containing phosphotransfer) domain-containing protein
LKGALANLSATQATVLAAQLERLGGASTLDQAAKTLDELEHEMPRVFLALSESSREYAL